MTSEYAALVTSTIIVAGAFLFLRLYPLRRLGSQGCDAYYFLLCAEEFRTHRRLPIVLPDLYLLEPKEQWYPPLFSVFCSLFPTGFLKEHFWLINHGLDLLVALFLVAFVGREFGAPLAVATGLIYAANAGLMLEYSNLTSRSLASLLFVGFMFAAYYGAMGSILAIAIAISFGVLLLFSHKMTVQLMWILIPALAVLEWNALWIVPLPASYLVAFAIRPRLLKNILLAHWDIVSFWYRNSHLLGAHQVHESPIYGDRQQTSTAFHRSFDRMNLPYYLKQAIHQNYFILVPVAALPLFSGLAPLDRFLVTWALVVTAWAFVTLYFPPLRCLGLGTQYFKYAQLPTLVATAALLTNSPSPVFWVLILAAAVLTIRQYILASRSLLKRESTTMGTLTKELEGIIEHIRTLNGARVICLPVHIADLVAYHARVPVLWGTHGYGFRKAEPFFPVLKRPIGDFVKQYNLTHLLLDKKFASLSNLKLERSTVAMQKGNFILVELTKDSRRNSINLRESALGSINRGNGLAVGGVSSVVEEV